MLPSQPETSAVAPMTCPQCQTPISAGDATCPVCGANIALVTLLAEYQVIGRAKTGTGKLRARPSSVEQLIPRLGEYLVREGYLTEAQLRAALEQQKTMTNPTGHPSRLLGQTLVDMEFLTRDRLDQAIAQQILELQTALLDANRDLEKRVTERTAELEETLVKLTDLNRLKANFVANISHELRTPLTQIKGYTSLLSDALLGPLTSEQSDALRVTTRSIERLEQLINDLITYATASKGELTLNLQFVSVSAVIARVIKKSVDKSQKRDLALTVQAPTDLPPVYADEEKLNWVLMQLVDNAIKFTPPGGRITVGARLDGRRVLFSVRDTGIGIPINRLNELFEPFQQLDGSATRQYGGTGLGLALVRRIIEAHGSEIIIDSQEGKGSVFSFALPQPPAGAGHH
jgi:signal transduction histidine kinase